MTPPAAMEGVQVARRPIRALSMLVANQIAAGEVVERPASVVKEVVENSLDAGATRLSVELEQGGIELIRITDDGHGMSPQDLPLAIAPHATSKIASVEDLDHIGSLGFRGEALASIASVSRLSIRSRTAEMSEAAVIEIEGDIVAPVRPASGPRGTQTTVRNLFFNTPARRKFLRTVATEQGRCRDVVEDLALAHPAVGFTLTCDGKVVLDLPPGQSPRARALAVLGKELDGELLEIHADQYDDARGLALWGLVGKPSIAKGNNKSQHLLVNGRAIRDRTIQHALGEGFRGLIEHTRYPLAVLMIEMSPSGVDVNVHPAKAEVRFRDSSLVHGVVLRAVRDALRAADLTPSFSSGFMPIGPDSPLAQASTWSNLPGSGLPGPGSGEAFATPRTPSSPRAFVDYFTRFAPRSQGALSYDAIREAMEREVDSVRGAVDPSATAAGSPPVSDEASLPAPTPESRVLQVHKSYLVTQDEQGMVIIDQHALHERAMFEYLLARVSARAEQLGALGLSAQGLESQRLLTPFVIPAAPAQVEKLEELAPLLTRIGIEARALSPTSVAVDAFPTFLFDRGVDAVEFMTELLLKAEASDFMPGSEDAMREVLDMMSCKAAVKAGDRLSDLELGELVKLRGEVERSSNCPHGRPTSVRLTIRELEKLFGRA
jgi:DNA mismatch repair protein MutL